MFEEQTESAIRQRMLDNSNSTLNKNEGGFLFDALSPAAIEMALAYAELDRVLGLGFAQTTSGTYLNYRASEHGLTRLEATKSTGVITVTGADTTVISQGSLFSTPSGTQFKTTAEATISGTTVNIAIEAVNAGISGNVPISSVSQIPIAIPGVTAVNNADVISGGTDTETDEALLGRLLEEVRKPSTSGNAADYIKWAKSVGGIGDARCIALWSGAGTVKVVIIDSNKQPANAGLITNVSDYIETVRPICATVTVVSATGVNINIVAVLTLAGGYNLTDVTTESETRLTNYLKSIAFVNSSVSYAQIGNIIIDTPGVLDYTGLTVNGGSANIAISNTQVAVLGSVSLSE